MTNYPYQKVAKKKQIHIKQMKKTININHQMILKKNYFIGAIKKYIKKKTKIF